MARIRPADSSDVDLLVELMHEFYGESGHRLDRTLATSAFSDLLTNPSFGRVWVLIGEGEPAGYVVLTLGYSLEYGGRDAFVDDLFVRRTYRGAGLGRLALETLMAECRRLHVRAVHLEVDRANTPAKTLYHKFGFRDNERQLLSCRLAKGTSP